MRSFFHVACDITIATNTLIFAHVNPTANLFLKKTEYPRKVESGVTIGENSLVGAGSVVANDVPEYSVVVGNPARIVKKILNIMGKSTELMHFIKDRPGHDFRYSLNSEKIHKELRWKPSHNFEKGLENTISWYIENKEFYKNISSKEMTAVSWKTR